MAKSKQETKKITKEQLEKLQELVGKNNDANNRMAQLCLNKERTFRNLQKEFDESFELIELQIKETNENQREFLQELDTAYGQGKSYDLSTGEIKDVEKKDESI